MLRGKATVPIRPLGYREILDLPFALIQANLRLLATSMLIAVVAAEVLVALVGLIAAGSSGAVDSDVELSVLIATFVAGWLVRVVLGSIAATAASMTIHGSTVTTRAVLVRARGHVVGNAALQLWQLVLAAGVALVVVLFASDRAPAATLVILGLLLALGAFAYFAARGFVASGVLVDENRSAYDAVRRSRELTTGATGQLLAVWASMYTVLTVLALPLWFGPQYVDVAVDGMEWGELLLASVSFLVVAAGCILVESSTRAVAYIDRRCRREALDLYTAVVPGKANA
ncbi:hypothetical protein [Antrihabitans stalactiti]|uniref:Uncharacterized protein n=1 Tax=Antrihabitans stalactiti TaxID=2584121 RepID=A0A848KD40_9NOCA|nr:hypothetical protein [Antrihabitans stalactiti]NMN95646.1 hypothetical protein [Antrihabitans stalactiti]